MEIGKYKLEVKDGIIKITPSVPEYYQIAESIANEIAESGTNEWRKICLNVINDLDYHSQGLKSKIVGKVSYGTGFYPPSQETVKGRKFEEAKAYIDGYTDAVNQFKSLFESSENHLIQVLNEVLPSN
jgi:hypothetical protein